MEIQLHSTKVNLLQLEVSNPDEIDKNEQSLLRLDFESIYLPKNDKIFGINFFIEINQPNAFRLGLDYIAWFKTSSSIDEDFKTSTFTEINAPAIAYPYLRAFITTITLNSGFEPFTLPTINFIKLNQQNDNQGEDS